jgi:hypothetical protein
LEIQSQTVIYAINLWNSLGTVTLRELSWNRKTSNAVVRHKIIA